ncbi:MAG: AAA family ATPase [Nitrospira sp.]|nr:AAA family ATPase [Nitrospira sp.]
MRPSHVRAILEREFLAASQGVHTPVMLWGPPGVGKSRIAADVAAAHHVPLIDIRLSQMEPTDLRGIPFRDGDRVEWSVPSLLPDAQRHGECGILFLDEITSAPPTVTAAAYQLILDRKLGEYAIPPGWAIYSAGNRYGDRGVTYVMPAPLANRFTHYEIEPHLEDWVDWAHAAGIDWRLIAFLRFRPDLLFEFDAARNPVAFPSPRSWEYAHRALLKFADTPHLLLESLQACVGQAGGVELLAFLDQMHEMPDVDAIARGESMIVPDRLDIQYGVATALVRKAQQLDRGADAEAVMRNVLRYARELPQRELGVMLVADMQRTIGQPLYALPEFKDWAQSVSELLLFERPLPE